MKTNSKEVVLGLDLPGFDRKDVKIKIMKNGIVVKAEKKQEKRIQRKDFFHEQKTYKSFSYVTNTPEINPKKAKISFRKGKLQIVMPRNKK